MYPLAAGEDKKSKSKKRIKFWGSKIWSYSDAGVREFG